MRPPEMCALEATGLSVGQPQVDGLAQNSAATSSARVPQVTVSNGPVYGSMLNRTPA